MWKRTENGFEITIQLNPFKAMSKALEKTANWLGHVADHISPESTAGASVPTANSQPAAESDMSRPSSHRSADLLDERPNHVDAIDTNAADQTNKQRKRFEAAQYYSAADNCLRLDLHGCTVGQAEQTLNQKILECHRNGIRFLDVVYGFSGRKLAEAINRRLFSEQVKPYIRDQCHVRLDYGRVIPCDDVDESTGVVLVIAMNPHRVIIEYDNGESKPVYGARLPCSLSAFKTAAGNEVGRLEATECSTLPTEAPILDLFEWMEHYEEVDVLPNPSCNNQWTLDRRRSSSKSHWNENGI